MNILFLSEDNLAESIVFDIHILEALKKKWNIHASTNVVVFMGYLYPFSRLLEFMREFPGIVKEVPDIKLIVVGDGPLRSSIEKEINHLGLENNIILTGGFNPFCLCLII